ncbi:hypothetical protein L3X38_003060 [Prunus dulcis]|uniref:Reverse transcriptase domain-containing protein n=1 Tax=Prunus dulcis TaxID=3755 RepID=A0AAD4ZLA4_PRUDU|nr:hypothetical protein L3X38_003060 [Prunus dulcis]
MELFNQPSSDGFVDVIPNLFPRLETVELSALNKVVDMAEVKDSLFSIGGLKAPRMDGFPACFYQNQWGQCAFDIFGMVVQVFTDCHVPNKLNSTLITLVPIVVSPQSPILPKLISHSQVRFVPGRHITGNILLAQELMHKYKIVKGKKCFVAWKIDMSKAYDRLSWKFTKYVLVELGLPKATIQLIMHCVSSMSYQICVNGELTEPFQPRNGIRQGDPLSPYLFVLCGKTFLYYF